MRIWRGIKNHFIPSADNAYQPHLLHRPWLLFFLAVILATEGFLVANLVARQSDQNFLAAVVPAEIIALTNTQREENNLNDLTENALLENAAQAKAEDMARNNYFSHNGPDGKTPWQWISGAGYSYQYAGENLAVRFIDSADVVNAWMQSPTHRENIVKPVYKEIGIGVAQGLYEGQPATYVVQYFASPLPVAAATAPAPTAVAVAATPTPVPSPTPSAQTPTPAPVEVSQTPPVVTPQVEGASVSPVAESNSFTQNVTKQLVRVFANPQQSSGWVLGFISTLLVLVLGLTFFMHLQVQPKTALASGALVAMVAISFLAINSRISEGVPGSGNQTASVAQSSHPGTVEIGEQGDSTEYALFPQVP